MYVPYIYVYQNKIILLNFDLFFYFMLKMPKSQQENVKITLLLFKKDKTNLHVSNAAVFKQLLLFLYKNNEIITFLSFFSN